ncbi:MAG: cyclodeaminase/cyclohydrolase family protein [Candidatus Brocadiia bacterium]
MYRNQPLETYLADAAAARPAPGGGSVSALAGALGATMACMAANFTVGKKKFRHVEDTVRPILEKCQGACSRLAELMDRDVEAYAAVDRAYRLPKDTDEEKQARRAAIQEGLRTALAAPLEAVRECLALVRLLDRLAETANPNLITDVGVAAILAEAALRGAKLNVEINLKFLKDPQFVQATRRETDGAAEEAAGQAASVVHRVYRSIGWPPED